MKPFLSRLFGSESIVAFVIFSVCFVLPGNFAKAADGYRHGKIAEKISAMKAQNVFSKTPDIFSVSSVINNAEISSITTSYTILDLNVAERTGIMSTKPEYLQMSVPIENGSRIFDLLLYRVDISPDGFQLLTSDGLNYPLNNIVHYRGSIDGDVNSVVSISFTEDEVMGLICNAEGNYTLGKLKGNAQGKHIVYNDRNMIPESNFHCETRTSAMQHPDLKTMPGDRVNSAKCVSWYWETDYDVYVDKGSVANVTAFMQAIFNEVQTLYANDGMSINLQTLFVWTTADPYTGPSSNSYLNQFGSYRTSFAGNVAHLIGYGGTGGIAWTSTLCSPSASARMAFSSIYSTYSTVPVYSWTVDCIAHEEGHVFGSPHTHECVWNGTNSAIDGCSTPVGCTNPGLPAGGGTIMSYCHLASVGKNFSLGFGSQPTQLMLYYENNGACLASCGACSTPAQPAAISGNATVCVSTTQTYSVTAVSGATNYQWTIPSGWSGISTSTSITVTTGSAGGNISVSAVNSCGAGTARTLAVTVPSVPAQPGAISGNAIVCANTAQTYSVTAVSGATSYIWTLPSGWSGTSASNSITTTAGNAGGDITVSAVNSCATGTARTLAATISSVLSQPGAISGSTSACPSTSQTYSVTAVSGATSYTWTLPSGWTGTSTTNSITATSGSAGGTISVKANNSCSSSTSETLAVAITAIPAQPGTITGSVTVCQNSSQVYSITDVTGATSYTWTKPTGWTGTSTTDSIMATVGTAAGTLSVKASNACGSSAARTLSTTIAKVPVQAGTMTGSTTLCSGASQLYSVSAVSGATSYTWILPTGWTGTSTTNSISSTAGNTSGSISVSAVNNCGAGPARTLAVTVSSVPSQPGAISGNSSVCVSTSQTYSVTAVAGATSYTWTMPTGWTGTSTTSSITTTSGSAGGTISVKANNGCGSSNTQTLAVGITAIPSQPGIISGNTSVCPGTSQSYSVTAVAGATSYTWTLPTGWTGTSTSNSMVVTAGIVGGTLSVKANNTCGISAAQTLATTITAVPVQPGIITGEATVCSGSSKSYSVADVTGATSYTWILPSGWSGNSNMPVINSTAGNACGTISVVANNSCGSSPYRALDVTSLSVPDQPAPITGDTAGLPYSTLTYSVTPVATATSYSWSLPPGWTGSSLTESIAATVGLSGGIISVTANNSCGSSTSQSMSFSSMLPDFISNVKNIKLGVFPNPANSFITFTYNGSSCNRIVVNDSRGRVVIMKENINNFSQLDISFLSSGYYTLVLEDDTCGETNVQFIKN